MPRVVRRVLREGDAEPAEHAAQRERERETLHVLASDPQGASKLARAPTATSLWSAAFRGNIGLLMPVGSRATLLALAAFFVVAPVAQARDVWRTPAPGVRVLSRTDHYRDGSVYQLYAAFVDLCGEGARFRVTAPDEKRISVPEWGERIHGLAAVNGDFFDVRPLRSVGPLCGNGQWWAPARVLQYDCMLVGGPDRPVSVERGALERVQGDHSITEVMSSQEQVVHLGAVQLREEIRRGGRRPRTGVGLTRDGHTLVLVVIDGGQDAPSAGASSRELAQHMVSLGVVEGVRLDGGGSTTLWVKGIGLVNRPSEVLRRVANHVGVALVAGAGVPAWCQSTGAAPR